MGTTEKTEKYLLKKNKRFKYFIQVSKCRS